MTLRAETASTEKVFTPTREALRRMVAFLDLIGESDQLVLTSSERKLTYNVDENEENSRDMTENRKHYQKWRYEDYSFPFWMREVQLTPMDSNKLSDP